MSRKKIGVPTIPTSTKGGLADKLAEELKSNRDYGQPIVYEHEYTTGKIRVTVIWDAWADTSLEDRSSLILQAYENVEDASYRDKIALASGLTVPEAAAAGLLPFQVIPGLRKTDPVKLEEVQAAMVEQGASTLSAAEEPQLRFATKEEAEACVQRLVQKLPASDQIWIISREMSAQDSLSFR